MTIKPKSSWDITVTLKDPENQFSLLSAITGIKDGQEALEFFLVQCAMHMVQDQQALDGLVRKGRQVSNES
jgi:hypothetical protein